MEWNGENIWENFISNSEDGVAPHKYMGGCKRITWITEWTGKGGPPPSYESHEWDWCVQLANGREWSPVGDSICKKDSKLWGVLHFTAWRHENPPPNTTSSRGNPDIYLCKNLSQEDVPTVYPIKSAVS